MQRRKIIDDENCMVSFPFRKKNNFANYHNFDTVCGWLRQIKLSHGAPFKETIFLPTILLKPAIIIFVDTTSNGEKASCIRPSSRCMYIKNFLFPLIIKTLNNTILSVNSIVDENIGIHQA